MKFAHAIASSAVIAVVGSAAEAETEQGWNQNYGDYLAGYVPDVKVDLGPYGSGNYRGYEEPRYEPEQPIYRPEQPRYQPEQRRYQPEPAPYQPRQAPYQPRQSPYQARAASPYAPVRKAPLKKVPVKRAPVKKAPVPVRKASPQKTASYQKSTLRGADRLKEKCNHPDTENFDTAEYNAQSAFCKLEQIWAKIKENDQIERWFVGPEFNELFDQDMNLTYDSVTDTMPINRVKRTHPRGVSTRVQFIAAPDTPYTGVFRGADFGIMRISETTMTTPEVPKTAPGYGLKLLRDGMTSANMLTMFAFDGQPSYNFFKNRWTTILREMSNECARETIGKKLAEVTDHIGATSVMEMAQYDQYG